MAITVVLINACSSLYLTGIIWYVQIAHYPLFPITGKELFGLYETSLITRTAVATAPIMVLELVGGIWLLFVEVPEISFTLRIVGFVLIALLWLITGFVQLPLHANLTMGFNERLFQLVITTNWIRVILWSTRTAVVVMMLTRLLAE